MYGCTGSAFVRHCTLPLLSKRCKKCSGRENVIYNVVDGQKRGSRMKKKRCRNCFQTNAGWRSSVNAACPLPAGRAIRRWSPGRSMCTTTRAMAIRKRNMIHTRSNRTASPAMRRRRPAAASGVRWIRGRCTERSAAFVKTGVPCKKEMCGISFSVQRI